MVSLKLFFILLLSTGTTPILGQMGIFGSMFPQLLPSFHDTMPFLNSFSSVKTHDAYKNGRWSWVAEMDLSRKPGQSVQVNIRGRTVVVETKYLDNYSSSSSTQSVYVPRRVDINQLVYENHSNKITITAPYIHAY